MILELRENVTHGTKKYPFVQYYLRNIPHPFQFPIHWHDEMEIIYVEEGELHVNIEDTDYYGKAGEIFFVNPRELHLMGAQDCHVKYFTLLFPLEFISFQAMDDLETGLLAPLRANQLVFPNKVEDKEVEKNIKDIIIEITNINRHISGVNKVEPKIRTHHIKTRIHLLEILQILYENDLLSEKMTPAQSNIQREMLMFIQNNYDKKISLSTLAQEFHLSEKYVSRYFVEHFRISFSIYVMHIRLSQAKKLLETTDMAVTEVALQCGFQNVSYFIRSFKKTYGVSPFKWGRSFCLKERPTSREKGLETRQRALLKTKGTSPRKEKA